jgi:hypothetical protein
MLGAGVTGAPTELFVPSRLKYGLMGSKLIRLLAGGHVELAKKRIVPLHPGERLADPDLSTVLQSVRNSPRVSRWLSSPWRGIVETHLGGLEARGVLRREPGKRLKLIPYQKWYVVDQRRAARVRRHLDKILVTPDYGRVEDRALVGLACAMDIERSLYPGRDGKEQRKRMQQIAFASESTAAPTKQSALGAAVTAVIKAANAVGRGGGGDGV